MKDIIPLMKIDDLEVRKLCCEYISTYATTNPDAEDAIPFFPGFTVIQTLYEYYR